MRRVNLPEDIESPRDDFLTHPLVETFVASAATKEKIDWNSLFGEQPSDRYVDLHCKLENTTQEVVKKGGKGYFWIVTSLELGSIFEGAKKFIAADYEQLPLGYTYVMFVGNLDKKWRVYVDPLLPKGRILIGAGFTKKPPAFYGVLDVENFR